MALINGLYVFVEDEQVEREVEVTSHPVEKGIDITDNVKSKPTTLSLKGKLVDHGDVKSYEVLGKLRQLQQLGSLIDYSGRNIFDNMQIVTFNSTHPNNNWGGLDFDMTLKQVRIAQSAYNVKIDEQASEMAQENKAAPALEVGAVVVFTGGSVYASSDAKNAAAKRGRSTCKITIKNDNAHPLHLISTDGGKVYGWVDRVCVEGVETSNVKAESNVGSQQVQNGDGNAVYHVVKKGECVYNLVHTNYKDLGTSDQWVIEHNPDAFSRKGDPTTLQIGARLLMGYRK